MSNVDVIKGLYKAFAEGDIDSVCALLDPCIEWIESDGIPYGGVFQGHEAVVNGVFAKMAAEWDNFTAHVDQFIDAGDIVITLGTDSGTFKATGQKMRAPTASIWTLKNGKVVKFRQYIDTLAVVSATN
ncbi:MAG: nuclear transport factor 2 family protein [Prochloraceae cyanobacterium]|nr:nuclear transport factor 2 family protein [Prochloraceae cyanobacterium]